MRCLFWSSIFSLNSYFSFLPTISQEIQILKVCVEMRFCVATKIKIKWRKTENKCKLSKLCNSYILDLGIGLSPQKSLLSAPVSGPPLHLSSTGSSDGCHRVSHEILNLSVVLVVLICSVLSQKTTQSPMAKSSVTQFCRFFSEMLLETSNSSQVILWPFLARQVKGLFVRWPLACGSEGTSKSTSSFP